MTDSAVGWRRIEPSLRSPRERPRPTLRTAITAAECPGRTAPGAPPSPRHRDDRDRAGEDAEDVGVALEADEPGQHVGLQRCQLLGAGRPRSSEGHRPPPVPPASSGAGWLRPADPPRESFRNAKRPHRSATPAFERKRLIRKGSPSQAHSGTQGYPSSRARRVRRSCCMWHPPAVGEFVARGRGRHEAGDRPTGCACSLARPPGPESSPRSCVCS